MGSLNNITAGVCDKRASGFLLEMENPTSVCDRFYFAHPRFWCLHDGEEMTVPKNLDAGPVTARGSQAVAGD